MGTNYYTTIPKCDTCGRGEEELHLGKSSFGWAVMLQANGYKYYRNFYEMVEWLKGKVIKDEYGEVFSLEDFVELVESKKPTIDPEPVNYGDRLKIIEGYKFYDCDFS